MRERVLDCPGCGCHSLHLFKVSSGFNHAQCWSCDYLADMKSIPIYTGKTTPSKPVCDSLKIKMVIDTSEMIDLDPEIADYIHEHFIELIWK